MADEELELDVTTPKSNKMTTILLIVLIVLVLIMGGVGAWLFLAKDSGDSSSESSDSGYTDIAQISGSTTTYTDSSVQRGKTYY